MLSCTAGVVNRDIKLENLLLKKEPNAALPCIKICDFGFSKHKHMSNPNSKVGGFGACCVC